jgi:hypothetical protein
VIELYPRVPVILPRHLIPSVVVVVLALVGPSFAPADPCQSTDGPQFACWIRDHTAT